MELYQIIFLVSGILLLIFMIIAIFYKKNYLKYLQMFKPIFIAFNDVLKAVGNIIPTNKAVANIVTIISAGIEAAGYAENLWLSGVINKQLRPEYAQQYIKMLLERSNIPITNTITIITDGIIAITCYLMPHFEHSEEV